MAFAEIVAATFVLHYIIKWFRVRSKTMPADQYIKSVRIALICYAIGYLCLTFLGRWPGKIYINIIPFRWLFDLLGYKDHWHTIILGYQIELAHTTRSALNGALGAVLNVLLYIPFGYLLPELMGKERSKRVIGYAFMISLMTEIVQLITRLGWFDVDDLINNVVGAAVGFYLFRKYLR